MDSNYAYGFEIDSKASKVSAVYFETNGLWGPLKMVRFKVILSRTRLTFMTTKKLAECCEKNGRRSNILC